MNPEQALQILEQLRQQASLTGTAHDHVREALNVLIKLYQDSVKPEPSSK